MLLQHRLIVVGKTVSAVPDGNLMASLCISRREDGQCCSISTLGRDAALSVDLIWW